MPTKQRRYLYDDSNLIAEFSVNPTTEALTLNRTYAWGLDMSGSLSSTGGVGALLQIADPSGAKYCRRNDGNGDPIEEQGGLNLYGFVGNDPVNRVDV